VRPISTRIHGALITRTAHVRARARRDRLTASPELEVRIHSPPAESQSLARIRLPLSRSLGFSQVCVPARSAETRKAACRADFRALSRASSLRSRCRKINPLAVIPAKAEPRACDVRSPPCSCQGQALDPRFRGGDGKGIGMARFVSGRALREGLFGANLDGFVYWPAALY
jgi:hypothetical protein